jgi:hypothetical protein
MIPGTGNLSATLRGDTWGGVPSITISPTTGATLESAAMQWRDESGIVRIEFGTEDGTIAIDDAGPVEWVLSIPARDLEIPAGVFQFDLQCVDANGARKTYWRGSIEVQQDVTYP